MCFFGEGLRNKSLTVFVEGKDFHSRNGMRKDWVVHPCVNPVYYATLALLMSRKVI